VRGSNSKNGGIVGSIVSDYSGQRIAMRAANVLISACEQNLMPIRLYEAYRR